MRIIKELSLNHNVEQILACRKKCINYINSVSGCVTHGVLEIYKEGEKSSFV